MSRAKRSIGTRRGNSKTARTYQKQTVGIVFENNIKEQLEKFASRLKDEVFRPAAFAGVTVLYNELQIRAPEQFGTLKDAMYRWREKGNIGLRETFYAGVNKRKAPHWWLVEHGHWQYYVVTYIEEGPQAGTWVTIKDKPLAQPRFVPAQPYLRPTADAKLQPAMQEAMKVLKQRLKALINGDTLTTNADFY